MKFFTQISNYLFQYSAFPDDVQDILAPFHQLYYLYSKLHNQLPKSDVPNIYASVAEIQFEVDEMYVPSIFLQENLYSTRQDIQHAYEHDLCSQLPLRFQRSHYYKFELSDHESFAEYRLAKLDSGISSPKQDELTFCLHYDLSFDTRSYCKTMKFIETKVAAMKLQGFNH